MNLTHKEIILAIQEIRPYAEWSLSGGSFENLVWHDKIQKKPTAEEVEQAWKSMQYKRNRVKEYPSIGDQLDAIWKGGKDMEEMKAKIDAVKSKFPKAGN